MTTANWTWLTTTAPGAASLNPAHNPQDVYGAARIGTGTKLHRAVKYARTGTVQILCGCPGTSSNQARVSWFFPDYLGTCKRSRIAPPSARCPRCGEPKPVGRSCDCFDNHCQ